MKKLLFVIYSLECGGSEKSLVNLLNEMPENEYDVELLLFQKKGNFLDQVPSWVKVLDTPEAMNLLYAPVRKAGRYAFTKVVGTFSAKIVRRTRKTQMAYRWQHFYRKKINRIEGHYDVAIAYGGMENLYLICDCVDADRRIVWIHSDYQKGKYPPEDDRPYFEKVDAIVSISERCVEVLKETFPEFSDRMRCIENITSSAIVRRQAEAYVPSEFKPGICNILSVGRLSKEKAFDRAIAAAALLKKNGVEFHWFVIGDGVLRDELTRLIAQYDVCDCFTLLGMRSNPYPYIKECTLFVQTSNYEGKSVVLDEAKILAKPIVVTNYSTVRDQIAVEKEGLIADMSAEGVALSIQRMLSDRALRERIVEYLSSNEYGNCDELHKYRRVIDG